MTHEGSPWDAWKQAVLEWHLEALAVARSEAWIPGLAGDRDPVVEKAVERFYGHHVAAAIKRLRAENLQLRRRVAEMGTRTRSKQMAG